jgi:hypothetical protein
LRSSAIRSVPKTWLGDGEKSLRRTQLHPSIPPDLRIPLTLYISSDDECAVWLDGELVHLHRGTRACTPDCPDVAYADATGTKGQIVVLVLNHGGTSAVSYLASRRSQQPVRAMLARASSDPDLRVRRAAQWWRDARAASGGDYREAEEAYFRGSIAGGFYGNDEGASGNQCVARGGGSNPAHWLSVPLKVKGAGPHAVRIRYACPVNSQLRVRIRRGDRCICQSEMLTLPPTRKDWATWGWRDIAVPASAGLQPDMSHIELVEPSGDDGKGPDIDVIGIAAQRPKHP